MYDIKPLEEEWRRYNKKKRKPWYFLGFGILFLTIMPFVVFKSDIIDFLRTNDHSSTETVKKRVINKESSILMDKALTKLELKKPKKNVQQKIGKTRKGFKKIMKK